MSETIHVLAKLRTCPFSNNKYPLKKTVLVEAMHLALLAQVWLLLELGLSR